MRCGLLGRTLAHSYSPQIHSQLGTYDYTLFEKEPEQLEGFLKSGDFSGLNVTIPYKKAVVPYCARLSPQAAALNSVNTIVREADGSLSGYNTDVFGFCTMVYRSGVEVAGKKVRILGSGGAAPTGAAVLQERAAEAVIISRSGPDNYTNLQRHTDAAVIVNATPVGMFPKVGSAPLSLEDFSQLEGVLDLIYNPARTQLLLEAQERGLIIENGLWMLVAQAKQSGELFTRTTIADSQIATIYRQLKVQMENIVLIGMPGSGKSAVGQALARALGREFVDADRELERAAGMSIPTIFAQEGEEGFRERESAILAGLGCRSGLVLSTGGGCVTKKRNLPLLRQNATIFCLERALDRLAVHGRPLSQGADLANMYAIRKPMYAKFADHTVDNNGSIEDTVAHILDILGGMA